MDEIGDAFISFVIFVVTPGAANGVAGLKRQRAHLRIFVEFSGFLSRQIFFKHLEIFAGIWLVMVIASDERRGLKAMDERVSLLQPPIRVRLIPPTVKPDAADG